MDGNMSFCSLIEQHGCRHTPRLGLKISYESRLVVFSLPDFLDLWTFFFPSKS